MANNGTVSLRLGSELHEKIKSSAKQENRTQHNYILNILLKYEGGQLTEVKHIKKIERFIKTVLDIPKKDVEEIDKYFERIKETRK